jgi:hypothetical protein
MFAKWGFFYEFHEFILRGFDFVDGNGVEESSLHGPEDNGLHFNGDRIVLRLLEQFDDAGATLQSRLGFIVQI